MLCGQCPQGRIEGAIKLAIMRLDFAWLGALL
jgi:hypothetical protein